MTLTEAKRIVKHWRRMAGDPLLFRQMLRRILELEDENLSLLQELVMTNVVWLALSHDTNPLRIIGIFDSEERAKNACTSRLDVIGPIHMNSIKSGQWHGAYYPLAFGAEKPNVAKAFGELREQFGQFFDDVNPGE